MRVPEVSEGKAILHALYHTSQTDRVQVSEMQTAALNEIASNSKN